MWGTRPGAHDTVNFQRFIPTHVGNTLLVQSDSYHPPVHPHACGEHPYLVIHALPWGGSSPRMWGTREVRNVAVWV